MESTPTFSWGSQATRFFFDLTPNDILDAVEKFNVRCTGRCLPLNSMENRVFEVEVEVEDPLTLTSPSERFRIIKFYRPGRWNAQQIMEEHQFLIDLKTAEIPVIAPLCGSDGKTLFSVPGLDIYFAVFPKGGGRHPDELTPEQMERIGRLMARMHNIGESRSTEGRIRLTPTTYGRQSLKFLQNTHAIPKEIQSDYADAVNKICDQSDPWFESVEYQRIHGDAHMGNLIWGTQGPFWVDFDDMVQGPPIQDLWLIAAGRDEDSQQLRYALLEGYENMRSFDWQSLRLIEPLRALRYIHFSAWIAKRWEDPSFPRAFPQFGARRYWEEQLADLQEIVEIMNA